MDIPVFQNEFNRPGSDFLPHRAPFLFLDTLVSADDSGSVGKYLFDAGRNEFFAGHFPGYPVVPGVVLVEAMTQSAGAGVVAADSIAGRFWNGKFILASVEKARFHSPVRPGDEFVSVTRILRKGSRLCCFEVRGCVGGSLAAECEVKCILGK